MVLNLRQINKTIYAVKKGGIKLHQVSTKLDSPAQA